MDAETHGAGSAGTVSQGEPRHFLCLTRQSDRAIDQFRKALELNPHFPMAQMALGLSYVLMGRSTREFDIEMEHCSLEDIRRALESSACLCSVQAKLRRHKKLSKNCKDVHRNQMCRLSFCDHLLGS